QFLGVRASNKEVIHVVGLIKHHGCFSPDDHFVTPIGEFRRDDGINIGTGWRIAHHLHWILVLVKSILQRSCWLSLAGSYHRHLLTKLSLPVDRKQQQLV